MLFFFTNDYFVFNGVCLIAGMSLGGSQQTQSCQATRQLGELGFVVEM